jgi:hypothetical protein
MEPLRGQFIKRDRKLAENPYFECECFKHLFGKRIVVIWGEEAAFAMDRETFLHGSGQGPYGNISWAEALRKCGVMDYWKIFDQALTEGMRREDEDAVEIAFALWYHYDINLVDPNGELILTKKDIELRSK